MKRKYGWKRDKHDPRDFHFMPKLANLGMPLPRKSSNLPLIGVYNQLDLGSCTGNGWAFEFEKRLLKQGLPGWTPSRLGIYFEERKLNGTINEDAGAEIRDGAKVIASVGCFPETLWPYDTKKFQDAPTDECYEFAHKHLGLQYGRVAQTPLAIKSTLAGDNSIVFGFNVYESFESNEVATSGLMPIPGPNEDMCGGHCVVAINYDDDFINVDKSIGAIECRNSWGDEWGAFGHFWIPYAFFFNKSEVSDLWALYSVE